MSDAIDEASAFSVQDVSGDNGINVYITGGGSIIDCFKNSTDPCPIVFDVKSGEAFHLDTDGIQGLEIDDNYNVTLRNNAREWHTLTLFGAGSAPDETNCTIPDAPNGIGGIPTWGMVCADNDSSTMAWAIPMPGAWDITTQVRIWGYQYNINASPSGVYRLDWSVGCQGNSEQLTLSTETSDSQMIFNYASGFVENDLGIASTNLFAPGGTCGQHDLLVIRAQVNASATTAAVADVVNVGFKMIYRVNDWSDN